MLPNIANPTQDSFKLFKDDRGVLYGKSIIEGDDVFFDCFDPKYVKSYNCAIIGKTGSGKSVFERVILNRYHDKGAQLLIIDQCDDGEEYAPLAERLDDMECLQVGGVEGVDLNPFALVAPKVIPSDAAEHNNVAADCYRASKFAIIGMFDEMVRSSNGVEAPEALTPVLSTLIDRTYQFVGVKIGQGKWRMGEWSTGAMPTMEDFYRVVAEYSRLLTTYDSIDKIKEWGNQNLDERGIVKGRDSSSMIMFGHYRQAVFNGNVWGEAERKAVDFINDVLDKYMLDNPADERDNLFSGTKRFDSTKCALFSLDAISKERKGLATYLCACMLDKHMRSGTMGSYSERIIVVGDGWKKIASANAKRVFEATYREMRKSKTGVWISALSANDFDGDNDIFLKYAETKVIFAVDSDSAKELSSMLDISTELLGLIDANMGHTVPGMGILSVWKENMAFYCFIEDSEKNVANLRAFTA